MGTPDLEGCERSFRVVVNTSERSAATPLRVERNSRHNHFLGSQRIDPCHTLPALKAEADAVFRLQRAESLDAGQSELELLAELLRG